MKDQYKIDLRQSQNDPYHADLKALLDGELSFSRAIQVRRHLSSCASCKAETTKLRELNDQLCDIETATAPSSLRSRILADLPQIFTRPALQIPSGRTFGRGLALGVALAGFGMLSAFALNRVYNDRLKALDTPQHRRANPSKKPDSSLQKDKSPAQIEVPKDPISHLS